MGRRWSPPCYMRKTESICRKNLAWRLLITYPVRGRGFPPEMHSPYLFYPPWPGRLSQGFWRSWIPAGSACGLLLVISVTRRRVVSTSWQRAASTGNIRKRRLGSPAHLHAWSPEIDRPPSPDIGDSSHQQLHVPTCPQPRRSVRHGVPPILNCRRAGSLSRHRLRLMAVIMTGDEPPRQNDPMHASRKFDSEAKSEGIEW